MRDAGFRYDSARGDDQEGRGESARAGSGSANLPEWELGGTCHLPRLSLVPVVPVRCDCNCKL